MSKLLPYEEQLQQQWTDIPLPDEDVAWEDMRKRLKDDDDDKGIFFWWRPGCALWGLLLLVLLGLGWWLIKPGQWSINKTSDTGKDSTVTVDKHKSGRNAGINPTPDNKDLTHNTNQPVIDTSKQQPVNAPTRKSIEVKTGKEIQEQNNPEIPAVATDKEDHFKETNRQPNNKRSKENKEPVRLNAASVRERLTTKAKNNNRPGNNATTGHAKTDSFPVKENVRTEHTAVPDTTGITSATVHSTPSIEQTDTATAKRAKKNPAKKPDSASLAVKPPTAKDSSSKKHLSFSTGIAVLQQLPIGGQKATPYNSQGRKGSLADYIPSVYVRLHNKEKWFLQAEFRYGAPQYSKDFLYQQVSIPDTGSTPRFTTNTAVSLKKTFYHQLPLTFNYYVLPNWSVGGGVVWNKFYAAISDQETIKRDNINQSDLVVFKGIVSTKEDTTGSIAKSYFQAVIESQYRWKRLSIGARYAFGLQPYIRFTLPGQTPKEEKNNSIQAFLRFELWRSRQK